MISISDFEKYIDERLAAMQKRPLMYGTPEMVEAEAYLMVEMYAHFCIDRTYHIRDMHQTCRRKMFPKCPGPPLLSYWLQDEKYGAGLKDENEVGKKVADFYIYLKQEIKNGQG